MALFQGYEARCTTCHTRAMASSKLSVAVPHRLMTSGAKRASLASHAHLHPWAMSPMCCAVTVLIRLAALVENYFTSSTRPFYRASACGGGKIYLHKKARIHLHAARGVVPLGAKLASITSHAHLHPWATCCADSAPRWDSFTSATQPFFPHPAHVGIYAIYP